MAAHAQIGTANEPLVVEAERLDVHNADGLVVYEGRVDAVQGESQVRANRLELYFDKSQQAEGEVGLGNLTHAIAIGDVYYITPEQTALGDRAVYDIATDTVTMTGNVIVKQGCDVLTGQELVLNLTTNDAQVRPGAAPEGAVRPARVRTVIYSGGDQDATQPAGEECAQ